MAVASPKWATTRKAEQLLAGLVQALGDGAMREPPFKNEGLEALLDLLARCRVDHVIVVGDDLLAQPLGRIASRLWSLCNGATLHRDSMPDRGDRGLERRGAVDDEKLRSPQTAPDQIVEYCPPGLVLPTLILRLSTQNARSRAAALSDKVALSLRSRPRA